MSLHDEPDDDDKVWTDAFNDNSDDDADDPPPAEQDPESGQQAPELDPAPEPKPSDPPDPAPPDDLDKLRHKLSSAEGRFTKFEEHIEGLKTKISELEASHAPDQTPDKDKSEPLPLPDGWTKEDWDDFEADYPVQAELLAQQNRQVQQLRERVDHTEQVTTQDLQAREFNDSIRKAHPDYDELLSNERDQIVSFIEGQANPTLKSAYQFIYRQGDAAGIIDLVTDYKERGRKADPPDKPPAKSRVDDALAVPGRSPTPANHNAKGGLPDEADFENSWNYFSDESLD